MANRDPPRKAHRRMTVELTPTVLPAPLVVAGNPALVEAISLMLIEAGAARA